MRCDTGNALYDKLKRVTLARKHEWSEVSMLPTGAEIRYTGSWPVIALPTTKGKSITREVTERRRYGTVDYLSLAVYADGKLVGCVDTWAKDWPETKAKLRRGEVTDVYYAYEKNGGDCPHFLLS